MIQLHVDAKPLPKTNPMIYAFVIVALMAAPTVAAAKQPLPTAHTTCKIEGWNVRVDDRLLKGEGSALGARVLKLLEARLVAISVVVPDKSLAKLRTITIQLDLNYGDLRTMQYHPDAGWLKEHGYSEQLAKCVHIPDVNDLLEPAGIHSQPWVLLHELAHGFHDQIVGFDEPRVNAAWEKFRGSGKYKSVLSASGTIHEHYGLTDHKEFFAEMTEAYFGSNDLLSRTQRHITRRILRQKLAVRIQRFRGWPSTSKLRPTRLQRSLSRPRVSTLIRSCR